jgi:phage terminase small subunit
MLAGTMDPFDLTDEEIRAEEDEEQRTLRESELGDIEQVDGSPIYWATRDGGTYEVDEEEYRILDQYAAAKRRQAEALALAERRWRKLPPPPDPADVAPAEALTPRQEDFCRHYAARPVAAHAALLAGYEEENARKHGSRLLKNPRILARIEALRAGRGGRHALEADTLQDKLESVFVDALTANHHAAAVAALRLQAGLARLLTRPVTRDEARSASPQADSAEARARRPETVSKSKRKADKSPARRRKKPTKADK